MLAEFGEECERLRKSGCSLLQTRTTGEEVLTSPAVDGICRTEWRIALWEHRVREFHFSASSDNEPSGIRLAITDLDVLDGSCHTRAQQSGHALDSTSVLVIFRIDQQSEMDLVIAFPCDERDSWTRSDRKHYSSPYALSPCQHTAPCDMLIQRIKHCISLN